MATFSLARFSQPEALKRINPCRLQQLLAPYQAYFKSRGLPLNLRGAEPELDFVKLAEILVHPDSTTPGELAECLYQIHEMSTPEGMDILLAEALARDLHIDGCDLTPTDVALQVYLQDPALLDRKHTERCLGQRRSFMYFQGKHAVEGPFEPPSSRRMERLEKNLGTWFAKHNRSSACRVSMHSGPDSIWFLVCHGDPFRREGAVEGNASTSVFYRPERFDIVVYDPFLAELRINADSQASRMEYRKQFGIALFGAADYFPGQAKYTLDPIRDNGEACLVCTDIAGIDWIRLREVDYFSGGPYRATKTIKADDVFGALSIEPNPPGARIIRAKFQVKFTGAKGTRMVEIRPSNIARYTRDVDAVPIEQWLAARGFVLVPFIC